LFSAAVTTNHSNDANMRGKLAQIAGDVGRTAGIKRFAGDLHHRDRRLGRYATHFAPNELVEHQVANDEQALFAGAVEDLLESF
jgi:hypothetical protein